MQLETNADWDNLIVSENLEDLSSDDNNDGRNQRSSVELDLPSTNLHKMTSPIFFILSCLLLIIVTTILLISSFPYLLAIDGPSDCYSGLVFASFFIGIPLVLFLQLKENFLFIYAKYEAGSIFTPVKLGAFHGGAFMIIAFSMDHKRVLCHLQEPLMGLVIIYLIVIYFIYKGPEMSSRKMLCLCGLLGGLFLAMDYQLNDIYHCRGKPRMSPADDGGDWPANMHTAWMIIYAGALFIFTISFLMLEKHILCGKSGVMSLRISTVSNGSQSGDTETLLDTSCEGVSETGFEGRPSVTPPTNFILNRYYCNLGWFLMSSFAFIIISFWIDFMPNVGKATSFESLFQLLGSCIECHFSLSDDCNSIAIYGWMFIISYIGFLLAIGIVFAQSGSMIFTLATASVALPISSFWWSIFEIGGSWGMTFAPKLSGEMVVSLLGLPVMAGCLVYWTYLDRRARNEANKVLVI